MGSLVGGDGASEVLIDRLYPDSSHLVHWLKIYKIIIEKETALIGLWPDKMSWMRICRLTQRLVRIITLLDTEASCSISQNMWETHNRADILLLLS